MATLNFKHLRYFWAVAKAGSIARAAKSLHLTPHAISGQLSAFEAGLGARLFEREGRRLVLSATGRRILAQTEEIFALGDEILEIVADPSTRSSSRCASALRIQCPSRSPTGWSPRR